MRKTEKFPITEEEFLDYHINGLQIISKDVAILLNETSFNEPCRTNYHIDKGFVQYHKDRKNQHSVRTSLGIRNAKITRFSAPKLEDAIRWLRETYNIRIMPTQKICGDFGFEIYIATFLVGKPFERLSPFTLHFDTYEEAQNAGIKHAIENCLINKN